MLFFVTFRFKTLFLMKYVRIIYFRYNFNFKSNQNYLEQKKGNLLGCPFLYVCLLISCNSVR